MRSLKTQSWNNIFGIQLMRRHVLAFFFLKSKEWEIASPLNEVRLWDVHVDYLESRLNSGSIMNRAFSLTWPASMLIYWNKRKHLHEKRVQLPQDWCRTPTWPPFHCFGTPIWPPWRHVKMLFKHICCSSFFISVSFCFPFVLTSLAYITIP